MDFSSKNKTTLKMLADHLKLEVKARKPNKPTIDELISALEDFEKTYPDDLNEAIKELNLDDEPEEDDGEAMEENYLSKKGNVFTYVGKGESSPQKINFMGRQEFVRGRATEVTDPIVFQKIVSNPSFVSGTIEPELLQDIEDEGIALAEKNRKIDKKMDDMFKRVHKGSE